MASWWFRYDPHVQVGDIIRVLFAVRESPRLPLLKLQAGHVAAGPHQVPESSSFPFHLSQFPEARAPHLLPGYCHYRSADLLEDFECVQLSQQV